MVITKIQYVDLLLRLKNLGVALSPLKDTVTPKTYDVLVAVFEAYHDVVKLAASLDPKATEKKDEPTKH